MRTIGIGEARKRVGRLLPQIETLKGPLEGLANARNSILDPEDAVQAAGVPESWELEDVNAEDFYADLEDDEYR